MSKVRNFQWGIALSGVAILLSFLAGMYMGTSEEAIREGWKAAAQPVMASMYNNDPAKLEQIISVAWTCFIRAHLHWGAIGAATLVMSSILTRTNVSNLYKQVASVFLGLGAIFYPISWLMVANNIAVLGKAAGKASGHIYAVIGIGTVMVGTLMFFGALICQSVKNNSSDQNFAKQTAK